MRLRPRDDSVEAPPAERRPTPREASATLLVRALRPERTLVRIRWAAVPFGLLQVLTYYQPYPPGLFQAALGLVGLMAVGNVVLWALIRRTATLASARRLSLGSLVLDLVVVMGLVFVYTFDADTAMWALVYVLPLEGATRFQLRGALGVMAVAIGLYVLRELFGMLQYGNNFLATSISFRMGIGVIIAWVAGAMASSLVRDREELERATASTERYAAELAATNRRLAAANEVKDDFLAMTNHELRTPLTTIVGYATMLSERWDAVPDGRKLESVQWISRHGKRLQALVEDLLTLSSAQAGALELELRPVRVCAAIEEAVGVVSGTALPAGSIQWSCPSGLHVWADDDRLVQVLTNYLSNALKYGAPPVRVDATVADGWVEIRVRDRGPGVPDDFVPRLFEKFSQASKGMSRTAQGTGLGLAIARQLVEAQGGHLWYERDEAGGASFGAKLRRAEVRDGSPASGHQVAR